MNKIKLIILDLFFVASSIIGVGFVTGKEISHYFTSGRSVVLAVAIFFVVFINLIIFILHVKSKYKINNLIQLNKIAFGKHWEICDIMLILFFIITNSAMLAGCDNIVRTYLGFNIPVCSLFLSCVTFFIIIGGIERIKHISKFVTPCIIILIIIVASSNFVQPKLNGSIGLDFIYPIMFCAHNFIPVISVVLNTKSNPKTLSFLLAFVVSGMVLILASAITNINSDMPMLLLSKNLGNIFFSVYLIGVIFALFTTLQIGTFQCLEIVNRNKNQKLFMLGFILLTCQIIAYLGFSFIVQYLYAAMGILAIIYLLGLIINLIIKNKNK